MKILLRTVLSLAVLASIVSPNAYGATNTNPKGSVQLTKSKLRQKTGYYCGSVKSKWVPGRLLSSSLFYPAASEISNLNAELKKAKGKAKTNLKKRVAALQKNLSPHQVMCSAIGKSSKKTSLTKVLSTQAVKWTRFQALRGIAGFTSMGASRVGINSADVLFDLSGAVGLARPEDGAGSGLLAVDESGNARDALVSGSVGIANFYSTPNGRLYVLFGSLTSLVDGGTPCLLAEVNVATGVPTCVDGSLGGIDFNSRANKAYGPIQFDASGNIFYQGTSSSGKTVIRRYSDGTATDLINDNIYISDFIVLPDGAVILSGYTQSTSAQWVRHLSASSRLSTLISGASATFLTKFADGNAYFGLWGGQNFGVRRFNVQSNALDPKYWISGNTNGVQRSKYFDAEAICESDRQAMEGFCGWYGAYIVSEYTFPETGTFAISGSGAYRVLMQYYPVVEKQDSAISTVTLTQGANKKLILTGTSAEGVNMTTVFDTESRVETIVVDASNEIEMYNITYVEASNKIMFNGLRFSDNEFVVGEIALGS